MQGIYIDGRRPKSKKEVKEAIAGGRNVHIEGTSLFGKDYDGSLSLAPPGRIDFVGPDPYTSRKFYGNIFVTVAADGKRAVKVK
jgi:hypothetical protein